MSTETPVFESFLRKEVTPEILERVYFEINKSFAIYFGTGVKPPFIRKVTWSNKPSEDIIGEIDQSHIILYPHWQETGENRPDMRTAFTHEMGHALYRQLLDNLFPYLRLPMLLRRGFAVSADEAFANLASIVDQGEGNPDMVTELLQPHITRGSLLFSPERIASYPEENDYFKDPAFLNFLLQNYDLITLMKALILIPSAKTSRLKKLFDKNRNQNSFRRYYSVLHTVLGINSDNLSRNANQWYSNKNAHFVDMSIFCAE